MIYTYDPYQAPDPNDWLSLDEMERILLVASYHEENEADEFEEDSLQMHAAVHAVVENQIAMGDDYPVKETAARLMSEGLSRHEALHAIGSVLASYIWKAGQGGDSESGEDFSDNYFREVESLTADDWLNSKL